MTKYPFNSIAYIASQQSIELVDCPKPAYNPCDDPCRELVKQCRKVQEKETAANQVDLQTEKTMFYDMEDSEDNKLNYLSNRASKVYSQKRDEAMHKYGMLDDDAPSTPRALIDRLASGKFTVTQENMDRMHYCPYNLIKWRDPATKEDQEGFKKADDALKAARTKAEDIIVVMSNDAARLKALQEFESTTIN